MGPSFHQRLLSAAKVNASVFWDADCILMVDCFQKRQTINRTYCASLLGQLRKNIKVQQTQ